MTVDQLKADAEALRASVDEVRKIADANLPAAVAAVIDKADDLADRAITIAENPVLLRLEAFVLTEAGL